MLGDGLLFTSSTGGTGALTCATQTGWPDPSKIWTGARFGRYTIVEWTSSGKTQPSLRESGIGSYDTSSGILTRTSPRSTWDGTNYRPKAGTGTAPSALNFGTTAANIDIMFTPATGDMMQALPFVMGAVASVTDGLGIAPLNIFVNSSATFTSGVVQYTPIWLPGGITQLSQFSVREVGAVTGGSPTLDCALFEIGSNGAAGKRLVSFTQQNIGAANTTYTSSALGTPEPFAGEWVWQGLLYVANGASGSPTFRGGVPMVGGPQGGLFANSTFNAAHTKGSQTSLTDPATAADGNLNAANHAIVYYK